MTDRDYLWCALNLALDSEETLASLCPACRSEAETPHCPVCGTQTGSDHTGQNASFDLARYKQLSRGEHPW
ncbi:MAG: molybdopterin oxidoreductase [Intestinimonas sp.]|jgi:predicted amidophosphoribosyltransferase|nr:molybdopterin oxidoreductase [Intestinimonas sp.]